MNVFRGSVLWSEPLVIFSAQIEAETSFPRTLAPFFKDRRVIVLFLIAWTAEIEHTADNLVKDAQFFKNLYPNHDYWFICNTPGEVANLSARGLKTFFANQNAFIDPNIYQIIPNVQKRFDAVYNAQLQSWKRHALCAKLDSVAFIYHGFDEGQEDYLAELRQSVPGAYFVNHSIRPKYDSLNKDEVVAVVNAARVGLCLSKYEGAMHASVEYMLCGLPVLTTPNMGGRDAFMDDRFTIQVDDNPEQVASGVKQLLENQTSPTDIRAITVAKQKVTIEKFQTFLNSILQQEGIRFNISDIWDRIYIDKLLGWHPIDSILPTLIQS